MKDITPRQNPFTEKPKLKVCAYVRVSTDHSAQMNSFQNQTEHYERKLRSNPAYEYCGIFSDADISGAKENRPGFQAMIEKALSGEIELIITKSISRFARNTIMLLRYVRQLKDAGVGILFEEEKINTLSSEGELMLTVLAAIAEEERKSVCTNLRWAVQKRYQRGEVMVDANRLIGYDKDKHGKLIINEEEAEIVRELYRLFLAGIPGYRIAKELNDLGVPTYSDNPWSSHRILRIISNEKNMGDCLLQKSYVSDNGKQKQNEGQKAQYYVKDNHPAIISRKDWEAAQRIREDRKPKTYPFSGMLRCPYCGVSLIRVIHEKTWVTWICGTYMHKGKDACKGMRIQEWKIEEMTKEAPLTEPVIVEEVTDGEEGTQNRTKKNFRLIPAAEYSRFQ